MPRKPHIEQVLHDIIKKGRGECIVIIITCPLVLSTDRKGVMHELLKRYTITDFAATSSGMQAMTIVGGGEVVS